MFVYYNANPENKIENDCVIRSISKALNINYYNILDMLYKASNYFNCDMLVKDCYGKLLKELGYKKYYGNGQTVQEIANTFYDKTLILRIDQHLTMSENNVIYDLWDTSNEIVDVFWIIE